MAIADRLNKLRTDIEDTYQAITEIGGTIPSNKNTNNIPEAIRSVYDNLPKVSDTGTNVSLSPTLKGRLGIVPKGNTLQDGEPTPETPVEIQSATGTQKVVVSDNNNHSQEVDIELSSRNKWDEEWEQGYYNANGNPVGNTENAIRSKNFIPVLPETNIYYYNGTNNGGRICFYDNNKNFISTITNSNAIRTTPANCYYIMFSTSTNYGSTYNNDICINISDEKNGTYTPYYNYSLNKIGDYEDYIGGTPDNWVLYKNIGKVVLNGSETWVENAATKGVFQVILSNIYYSNIVISALSNYFKGITGATIFNSGIDNSVTSFSNNRLYFRYNYYANNLSDFKTWLSTHNTEVLYVLAEAQQISITEEPLVSQLNELYYLQSYNDTTNIDVTGNLPMRITASAIKGA